MKACEKNQCTGCCACVSACPVNCVSCSLDDSGFCYPLIDGSKCVDCGLCSRICPSKTAGICGSTIGDVYLAVLASDSILNSSSGGFAFAAANEVVKNGGVAFGAIMSDMCEIKHEMVSSLSSVRALQGSKYVQSSVLGVYEQVKQQLEMGISVVFFGVGCQIRGLKAYLGSQFESEQLITVGLLCRGASSPKAFKLYVEHLKLKYGQAISDLNFRDKSFGYDFGYLCSVVNGRKFFLAGSDASFPNLIGRGYIRQSCFSCPAELYGRVEDITIGDCVEAVALDDRYARGASLVISHTDKGRHFVHDVSGVMLEQASPEIISIAEKKLAVSDRGKPKNYYQFFADLQSANWAELYSRYLKSESTLRRFIDELHPLVKKQLFRIARRLK